MFLREWVSGGAVALVTHNPQRVLQSGGGVADAWHHEVVAAVEEEGVRLVSDGS